MDSILTSVKKMLGIAEDYTHFDADLIIHINTVLTMLRQLGVGPVEGFVITDSTATWDDFLSYTDSMELEMVRTYVYHKVKLLFDPPLSSSVLSSTERLTKELEWRLNVAAENYKEDEDSE